MEIKLNVELKVPEGIISNLAEVDKTKLEEYLQECLVKYLSASKQEPTKKELDIAQQILSDFALNGKQGTKEFKFDDIGAMTNK